MSGIANVGSNTSHRQEGSNQSAAYVGAPELPAELWKEVLSWTTQKNDFTSLSAAARVNRLWFSIAAQINPYLLEQFQHSLLIDFPFSYKGVLETALSSLTRSSSDSGIMNTSPKELIKNLIPVLSSLEVASLDRFDLTVTRGPVGCHKVFKLAKLSKSLATDESHRDLKAQDSPLRGLLKELTKQNPQGVLDIAELIPDATTLFLAVRIISSYLAELGHSALALKAVYLLSDVDNKNEALRDVAEALARKGETESAIKVAQLIISPRRKNLCLQVMSADLARKRGREDALRVAKLINDIDLKGCSLAEIENILTEVI